MLKLQYFGHLKWRADSLEETLMLGRIEGRRRKGWQDKMVGWHHWLNGCEFEQAPGDGEGQGSLVCCSPWGHKSGTRLSDWTTANPKFPVCPFPLLLAATDLFSVFLSLFLPCRFVPIIFRSHIKVISYAICLSDLLHLAWSSLVASMLLETALFSSFLWLSSVPLHICTTSYLSLPLEIQPVHSEGDQPWDFFGRNDAKAEAPVLWPPHAKCWLIGKYSDAGRDWG